MHETLKLFTKTTTYCYKNITRLYLPPDGSMNKKNNKTQNYKLTQMHKNIKNKKKDVEFLIIIYFTEHSQLQYEQSTSIKSVP